MIYRKIIITIVPAMILSGSCMVSCSGRDNGQTEEQITIGSDDDTTIIGDSTWSSVEGNLTMKQVSTFPNKVILTGLDDHRLVSIYKSRPESETPGSKKQSWYSGDSDEGEDENIRHFMPGIDILFGYNLLNIAHYDLKSEKTNFLFSHPVLVKTLYYPSFYQDSIDKEPINRNYFLVSVYDEDTNNDSLINKMDLRRFYQFDAGCSVRTQLIPPDYSAIRSQYDAGNDIMYVFAGHDENKNGTHEKPEPVRIFWFSLKTPGVAKLLY